jgi:uncharacterized protein
MSTGQQLDSRSRLGPFGKVGYGLLRILTTISHQRPWAVLILACMMSLLSLFYASRSLEIQADPAALFGENDRYRVLDAAVKKEFPNGEDLVVVVANGTARERELFIEALSSRLQGQPQLYADVFARMDLDFFRRRLLYYLTPKDLNQLSTAMEPVVDWLHRPTVNSIASSGQQNEPLLQVVARMAREFKETLDTRGEAPYTSLWKPMVMTKAPPELKTRLEQLLGPGKFLYHSWPNSPMHVLLVRPANGKVRDALTTLDEEIKRLTPAYTSVDVGVTGMAAIKQDEKNIVLRDALRCCALGGLLLIALFLMSFSNRWRPWMVLTALLVSLAWVAGFATAMIGHVNLLSLTVAPVLFALGAGFGIHLLYGYEAQRAQMADPLQAMLACMARGGMQIFAAAVITAGAFLMMTMVDLQSVVEFGKIAAGGILLCLLGAVTVLPALLFLHERHGRRVLYTPRWTRWLKSHEMLWLNRPVATIMACALLTVMCLANALNIKFDHNLLHLQHTGTDMSRTEDRLLHSGEQGVFAAQYLAPSIKDAKQKAEQFSKLKSVARVESPLQLLTEQPDKKTPHVRRIATLAQQVEVPQTPTMGAVALQTQLASAKSTLGAMHHPAADTVLEVLRYAERTAFSAGPGPVVDSMQQYFGNVRRDLQGALGLLREQTADPVTLEKLPRSLRMRSIGATGKIMLQIYPKENPWDYHSRKKFVGELQAVDPDVIGMPVILHHQTEVLTDALQRSAVLAASGIIVLLLVYFRNPFKCMLVMLPAALGLTWTIGAMGLSGVNFNLVNFLAIPTIVAVGFVYGLHIAQRMLFEPLGGVLQHPIGAAVSLSGLTSLAVFGSLMTAGHEGIKTLGFVLTVGVAANLFAAVVAVPALMRVLAAAGLRLFADRPALGGRRLRLRPDAPVIQTGV